MRGRDSREARQTYRSLAKAPQSRRPRSRAGWRSPAWRFWSARARTIGATIAAGLAGWTGTLLRPRRGNPRGLTSREADIACHVSRGLSNKEIGRELHMSEGTVKMHLHHIYGKLHLGGRTQLALWMATAEAQLTASGNTARVAVQPASPAAIVAPMVLAGYRSKNLV